MLEYMSRFSMMVSKHSSSREGKERCCAMEGDEERKLPSSDSERSSKTKEGEGGWGWMVGEVKMGRG